MLATKKTVPEEKGIFIEGDIVWIKISKLYWPATVTKVLKRCKKAVVKLIHTQNKKKAYTKSFKDLIDFKNLKRNKKLLNAGKEGNCEVEEAYRKAVDLFDKRNNDGSQKMDLASSKRMSSSDEDVRRIEKLIRQFGKTASDDEDDKPGGSNVADSAVKEASPDGQKVIEQVKKRACFRYLKGVFQGWSFSERHKIFMQGSLSDTQLLKFSSGVGPLDDEQIQEVYKILLEYLPKIAPDGNIINPSSYIFDVLLPEAIVFALEKIYGINKQEAEKTYKKMTICTWKL